ncbi:MAG: hypothetical protein WBE52_12385 [Terriglobales bacterium]
MLGVSYQSAIQFPWTTMPPLLLGNLPSGLGTADLFIAITDNGRPILRVDLYAECESTPFKDAVVWGNLVFVGYGDAIYVIDPGLRSGSIIALNSYFAAFYSASEYLLVASGTGLVRLSPEGDVIWRSPNLALDGVIVTGVDDTLVKGEGEWDPPGGCKSFMLRIDSGELTT